MAGLSKLGDNSCVIQCNETLKSDELKLQSCFVELVSGFLKFCSGNHCFRPLPPRLGNGDSVDLHKLYFVVQNKGGFESICDNNLWGEVGLECGFVSSFGSAFKLIYAKYLSSLESWILNLEKEETLESKSLMELLRDYRAHASKIMDVKKKKKKNDGSSGFKLAKIGSDGSSSYKLEKSGISFCDLTGEDDENESEKLGWKKLVMDLTDSEGSNEGFVEPVNLEQHNVEMCFSKSTVKPKQHKVEMSFADAGDSTEGNGDSVDSKQQDTAMDSANAESFFEQDHGGQNLKRVKSEMSSVGGVSLDRSYRKRFLASPVVVDDVIKSSENSIASKKCSAKVDEEVTIVDSVASKEVSSHKRKRDHFSGMLQWLVNVAKDPTDPVIGEIPERSKWASYGNDKSWKQAFLTREALFQKESQAQSGSAEQVVSQKTQKVQPSYQTEAYPERIRQRLEARLDMQPTASIYTSRPQQRIPVGKAFQVEVPKWTGVAVKSDSKWLGTRTWPLEKAEKRGFVERDPLGKGRVDNCGCQFPGSTECVKFHVSERRMKIRSELGSAFYAWKFDKMGENCSIAWTADEEKKFRSVIKENPQSAQKCFWEPMCRALPQKRWTDQVNYYYNVFMLRRRGYQNRHSPSDIDSDDDETEYRSTNNSVRSGTA